MHSLHHFMEQLVDVFNWRTQLGIRRDYQETGCEVRAVGMRPKNG